MLKPPAPTTLDGLAPQSRVQLESIINTLLRQRLKGSHLRSRSLIMTLFGDYISVFAQPIPLTTIINLLAFIGLKDSLIRTTINRLHKAGWIAFTKSGRNTLYSITDVGKRKFRLFSERIYRPHALEFGSECTMLIADGLGASMLQKLRRQLFWLGFSPINPRCFVYSNPDNSQVCELLDNLGLKDKVIVGSFKLNDHNSRELLLGQALKKLPITTIDKHYRHFFETYQSLRPHCDELTRVDAKLCFRLRLLLIHDYRRAQLHDPDLSRQYLPKDWIGTRAHRLMTDIYSALREPSSQYFARSVHYDDKLLQKALAQTESRFQAATPL